MYPSMYQITFFEKLFLYVEIKSNWGMKYFIKAFLNAGLDQISMGRAAPWLVCLCVFEWVCNFVCMSVCVCSRNLISVCKCNLFYNRSRPWSHQTQRKREKEREREDALESHPIKNLINNHKRWIRQMFLMQTWDQGQCWDIKTHHRI